MSNIKIIVNGKEQETGSDVTLLELVNTLNVKNKMFAVELNNEIIQKEAYAEITLKKGDSIEIVTFFGGG